MRPRLRDHELLIAKFRPKLKKVGKTARPFRHDLNQTPYDYTVEVRNELWTEVCDTLQETGIKIIPMEMQKSTMAFLGGLTNSCEKKRSKKKRRKEKI